MTYVIMMLIFVSVLYQLFSTVRDAEKKQNAYFLNPVRFIARYQHSVIAIHTSPTTAEPKLK